MSDEMREKLREIEEHAGKALRYGNSLNREKALHFIQNRVRTLLEAEEEKEWPEEMIERLARKIYTGGDRLIAFQDRTPREAVALALETLVNDREALEWLRDESIRRGVS